MPTIAVNKLAQFFNLSPRRIQQLVKEGMPRGARDLVQRLRLRKPQAQSGK